ncbi:3515_t:CDS:1, partial [Rhizophagus irregularis]
YSTRAKLVHDELAQAFQAEPSQAMIKLVWWLTSQLEELEPVIRLSSKSSSL